MLYKGFKITVRCIDWEQEELLDLFWNATKDYVASESIVGLGMNWRDDGSFFDYALGVIDDDKTLAKLREIDFSKFGFDATYIEINLPDMKEWKSFKGHANELRDIYEKEIDYYQKEYDYELEYIDSNDNLEIKIHYIND